MIMVDIVQMNHFLALGLDLGFDFGRETADFG